jgi:hypothetical protein
MNRHDQLPELRSVEYYSNQTLSHEKRHKKGRVWTWFALHMTIGANHVAKVLLGLQQQTA